jgi:hypothetical protein
MPLWAAPSHILTHTNTSTSYLDSSTQTTNYKLLSAPSTVGSPISTYSDSPSSYEKLKETFGMTYFSYFYGPGLHPAKNRYNPNQLGLPGNDGIYFQNQVSIRYKFSSNLALDLQTRFNLILNNSTRSEHFQHLRWETPRVGVSGKLLSGNDWTLTGAINTDFPYFFPVPLTGYQSQQRKSIFTPGMFTALKYEPKQSPWSIFSVITPRYFFYADRDAAEPQLLTSGLSAGNKPEMIIALQPTINYAVSPLAKLTLGTNIDYRKYVASNWNPFHASLITNGDSTAWRLSAVSINAGVTYKINSYLTIFPFITTFPIAIQRMNMKPKHGGGSSQASLIETTSVAMWINGTLF